MARNFNTSGTDPLALGVHAFGGAFDKGFSAARQQGQFDETMSSKKSAAKARKAQDDKEWGHKIEQDKTNTDLKKRNIAVQEGHLEIARNKAVESKRAFGKANDEKVAAAFWDKQIFGENLKVHDENIRANKFQFNQAATELAKRDAVMRVRQERLAREFSSSPEGEAKAPVIVGMKEGVPVYLKDKNGDPITFKTKKDYDVWLATNVDPLTSPLMTNPPGATTDPNNSKFMDSSGLRKHLKNMSTSIAEENSKRKLLKYKYAKLTKVLDPRDITMFDGLIKRPSLSLFFQLKRTSNFHGMSDNQKQGILESIVDMGMNIEEAVKFAYQQNRPEHGRYLQGLAEETLLNPEGVYDIPMDHKWFYKDPSEADAARGAAMGTIPGKGTGRFGVKEKAKRSYDKDTKLAKGHGFLRGEVDKLDDKNLKKEEKDDLYDFIAKKISTGLQDVMPNELTRMVPKIMEEIKSKISKKDVKEVLERIKKMTKAMSKPGLIGKISSATRSFGIQ